MKGVVFMPKIDFIPVEVLMDQYELDLCDQGILPNAPLPEKKGDPYPRIELMAEKGDEAAILLLASKDVDLSKGLPKGYAELEEKLMSE